jgi:cytochrome c oxidase subunit II
MALLAFPDVPDSLDAIGKYLERGADFSGSIDGLILLVLAIVGFWGLLAEAVFIGFIFRFAARDGVKAQYISGEDPKQKRWVAIPHYMTLAFDVLIIVAALRVWSEVKLSMPQADETVRVTAQQWAWTFTHPGPDGKLDTEDDIRTVDELHVEVGKTYHFELLSRDVLHSFSVPIFRLKQDAVPGRIIKGWFKPIITGQYDIQCTEICGIGHGLMPAKIIIAEASQHADWVKANAGVAAVPAPVNGTPGGMP